MITFLQSHIFGVQISLFLFILCFFWILENIFLAQTLRQKFSHSLVNIKFLFFVIPVQISLSVILLSVAAKTERLNIGLLNHLPV
ncbi:hypothetical protein SAMN05421847_0713 [Halpernia humi]|uniref:Uncharacterized protein n=1 Tax=Halpernia humi TaxID=493375 RepID=A0A1H5U9I8_9FLAO|nr:hypothetical protein SAMN05421847_0713 [Halpernia humi]